MTRCQRCFGELSDFAVFCPHCAQVHEPDLAQLVNQTVGQTVGNRYKLYRCLGQGGLSTVFAATDLQTDSVVVVKVSDPAQLVRRELTYAIDAEAARNYWQEMLERMRREAEALTGIDHPNIVRFFDTGMIGDDLRFVVMEFLRGRTLREELDSQGWLEPAEAANIALQLCAALGEVHARGIVHRDISPRNVMIADCGLRIADSVSSNNQCSDVGNLSEEKQSVRPHNLRNRESAIRNPQSAIKLIDFGIAKFPQPPGAPPFTQHSVLSGTVAYASPEQCQSRAVDHRSDIYSMGVMLYEMLTGERPFTGRTPTEIAIKHLQAEPLPPRLLNPAIPANLEITILRALAKAPEERQQSVQELSDELCSIAGAGARQIEIPLMAGQSPDPDSEENLAAVDRLKLVRRRRRRVAVAAAALLLALVGFGAIFGKDWLASRALPLFAVTPELGASPSHSPDSAIASDSDSLELAARLSGNELAGDPLVGGVPVKNSPSHSTNQTAQSSGASSAVPASGNAAPNVSAKQSAQSSVQPGVQSGAAPTAQTAKATPAIATPQIPPAPAPAAAVNRAPQQNNQPANQAANQPDATQAPRKSEERKIRQREAGDSASVANGTYNREQAQTASRDRIAANRSREEENARRQPDSSPGSGNQDSDGDEPESANRQESEQLGPKLIQWSGRVNGEREVIVDLPGVPGTVEIPRIYRNRVGVIEPPSATNRWRCARLRVFGEGGVSFVVRWWPRVVEATRLIGRK